jgi:DNA-binding LacI/PurR family transcriptional regulator
MPLRNLENSSLATLARPDMYKHVRLAKRLIYDIARRSLVPGDRLGTESEIVEEHGLSRTTVRQALAILEREGFVTRKQRLGTLVAKAVAVDGVLSQLRGTALLLISSQQELGPDGDPASLTIFQSIVHEMGQLGFAVQVIGLDEDPDINRHRLLKAVSNQDVEVVCSYAIDTRPYADLLVNVPLVTVGTGGPPIGQWVGLDMQQITYDLTRYLLDHHHLNIAMFCGSWISNELFSAFAIGYRKAFEERNLEYHRERLFPAYKGESLTEMVQAVLEAQHPTAVIAEDWRVCHAVVAAAKQLGLRIPEDLSIVACGKNAARIESPVQITAYVPDNKSVGKEVAKWVVETGAGSSLTTHAVCLKGRFVAGKSVQDLCP